MSVTFTAEQIKDLVELKDLSKLSGNEIMLIETPDGSNSYKTTVNTLLGFMATQLYSVLHNNQAPEWLFNAQQIVVIPEGEQSEVREEGNFYLKVKDDIIIEVLNFSSSIYSQSDEFIYIRTKYGVPKKLYLK